MAQPQTTAPFLVSLPFTDKTRTSGLSKHAELWMQAAQSVIDISSQAAHLYGTHTQRLMNNPASSYIDGSVFYETDRGFWYMEIEGAWEYLAGVMQAPQAKLPADLAKTDAGALVLVSDYGHLLMWTGTAWQWGPGEVGSGFVLNFAQGIAPGAGWHLCDGTEQQMLQADGTLVEQMLPQMGAGGLFGNLAAWFRQ